MEGGRKGVTFLLLVFFASRSRPMGREGGAHSRGDHGSTSKDTRDETLQTRTRSSAARDTTDAMENHGAAVDTLPGIAPWDANQGTDALDHMLLAGASEYGASEFLHAAPPDEFQARSLGPLDRLEKRLQADAFPTAFPVPELPEREGGRPGKRAVSRAGKRAKIARSSPQKADTSAAKGRESPQRSKYKGVSKHKHTGKFEAHLWDASVKRAGGKRKNGAQIYVSADLTSTKHQHAADLRPLFCHPAPRVSLLHGLPSPNQTEAWTGTCPSTRPPTWADPVPPFCPLSPPPSSQKKKKSTLQR